MSRIPAWSRDQSLVEQAFEIIQRDGKITQLDLSTQLKMGVNETKRVHKGIMAKYTIFTYKKGTYIYNYAVTKNIQKKLESNPEVQA